MRALSQLLSLQWHVQEIRKWLSTCQMNPFCCVTSFSDSWSTSCSSWTLPAHPAAPAPTGEILAPFPAYSICFAKAGEQSPSQAWRICGSRAGSPADWRAGTHALGLLKIEWFLCVSTSCSSIPHDIFWLHPWSVTCTSCFGEWQLSPGFGGRLGILRRKREISSAESEREGRKRKRKGNISPNFFPSTARLLPYYLMGHKCKCWEKFLGPEWKSGTALTACSGVTREEELWYNPQDPAVCPRLSARPQLPGSPQLCLHPDALSEGEKCWMNQLHRPLGTRPFLVYIQHSYLIILAS